jgi:hypothetical protein
MHHRPTPVPSAEPDHYALHGNAFNPDTDQLADYIELSQCSDTMFFIPIHDIPKGKKATYLKIVAAYRPEKANPHRIRFTVSGDRIDYPGGVSMKTANLPTVKTLFNSVISTPNARFMTTDLKDFNLGTPLAQYKYMQYMQIPVSVIPESIMAEYKLLPLRHHDHVYVEIRKGMYGLPQAGRIANDHLTDFLAPHGYTPMPITPGLWKDHLRSCLCACCQRLWS